MLLYELHFCSLWKWCCLRAQLQMYSPNIMVIYIFFMKMNVLKCNYTKNIYWFRHFSIFLKFYFKNFNFKWILICNFLIKIEKKITQDTILIEIIIQNTMIIPHAKYHDIKIKIVWEILQATSKNHILRKCSL